MTDKIHELARGLIDSLDEMGLVVVPKSHVEEVTGMLSALMTISNWCVADISNGCRLDAAAITDAIYAKTGLTNEELNERLRAANGGGE